MKFVVFSDIHYASEVPSHDEKAMERKLVGYAVPLVDQLIDVIDNKIKPDVAICLGDFIEDLMNHDKDIQNFLYIWKLVNRMKTPLYSTIGNHELRSMENEDEIKKLMGYDNLTYSIEIMGYHLVFLGLSIDKKESEAEGGIIKTRYLPEKDIEWLKNDLGKNELPCIVFCHYGIAEDEMKGNWWFDSKVARELALLGNRDELKDIFKSDGNVLAVFSGHQHWTKILKEDGIDYYVVGSLTENIDNDGVPDGVYFEVEVEGKELRVEEKHLRL